jgi:hypothetical protein
MGLTLQFLLGALRVPTGATASLSGPIELTRLLESMRDETPASHCVRIAECDRLRQPVAMLLRLPYQPGVGFASLPSPRSGRVSLYVSQQFLADASGGVNTAAGTLWEIVGPYISTGHFSFSEGRAQDFSEGDLMLIRDAFAIPDEDEA